MATETYFNSVNLHSQAGQQEAGMSGQEGAPSACKFETGDLVIKLDETIQSDVSMIDGAVAKIVKLIKQSHCCDETENIDLALREALANAIIHGNRSNREKFVRVCLAVQRDCTILIIERHGPGL
jgi:hypothetical protein